MIRKTSARILSLALALMLACSALVFSSCSGSTSTTKSDGTATAAQAASTAAAATTEGGADKTTGETVNVVIDVKDYGEIKLELYPDIAPKTVANFKKLAEIGFC